MSSGSITDPKIASKDTTTIVHLYLQSRYPWVGYGQVVITDGSPTMAALRATRPFWTHQSRPSPTSRPPSWRCVPAGFRQHLQRPDERPAVTNVETYGRLHSSLPSSPISIFLKMPSGSSGKTTIAMEKYTIFCSNGFPDFNWYVFIFPMAMLVCWRASQIWHHQLLGKSRAELDHFLWRARHIERM